MSAAAAGDPQVSAGAADAAPLRVLHLEDVPLDAELVCSTLTQAGLTLDVDVVATRDDFVAALGTGAYDIILADYKLPGFDAHAALRLARERHPGVPVIVVSGTVGEETAVELLKQGATDYVIKDRLERLPSAVRRALDEAAQQLARWQAEQALRESEDRYRTLFDTMAQGVVYQAADGDITSANPAAQRILGLSLAQMQGRTSIDPHWRALHGDSSDFPGESHPSMEALRTGKDVCGVEMGVYNPETDAYSWILVNATPQFHAGETTPCEVYTTFEDITERKLAEVALRALSSRQQTLLAAIPDIVVEVDKNKVFTWTNPAGFEFYGEDVLGKEASFYFEGEQDTYGIVAPLFDGREDVSYVESWQRRKDGQKRLLAWWCRVLNDGDGNVIGALSTAHDITARKQAEEALAAGAERLRATLHDTVRAMGAIIYLRDRYTGDHQRRVTRLAEAIAAHLGLDAGRCEGLHLAAEVHDVGKIGVPVEILSKPAKLSEVELSLVREHAVIGRQILSTVTFDWPVAEIVGQHHERLDGSGYPDGLKGEEILLEARIMGVADVVEAMASHRPYRPALGIAAALAEVREGAGTRYDADVVAACEAVIAGGFALAEDPE